MANNLAGRPWIIDTASTNAQTPLRSSQGINETYVIGFIFYDYSTGATDEMQAWDGIRNNGAGIMVAHLFGNSAKTPVSWFFGESGHRTAQPIKNLSIPVLSSGKVAVIVA